MASLAAAVVLPVPCRPARRMTVGLPSVRLARGACSAPMISTSSSFITFTNCCSGVTPGGGDGSTVVGGGGGSQWR